MSAAVALAPSLRNDIAACERYAVTRLRMAARDPFGLALLAFAGVVTVLLWMSWLGIDPLFSRLHPWPAWFLRHDGPAPTAAQLAFHPPGTTVVVVQLLWALLVAVALGRESARRRSFAQATLAGLPVGARARALADVLVAISLAMIARGISLAIGGIPLGMNLFGHSPRLAVFPDLAWAFTFTQPTGLTFTRAAYVSAFAMSTVFGVLIVSPLVLAWRTMAGLGWRDLLRPAIAAALVFAGVATGAMAHLASALPISVLACAFVLVRVDDGGARSARASTARPLRFRVSPGPLAQLRRDAWRGPLREHWRFLLVAVVVPLIPAVTYRIQVSAHTPGKLPLRMLALGGVAVSLQWLALLAVPLLPFGLALVPAGARPAALFGGTFLRSWSALPVPRRTVVRAVYLHGLLGAGFGWLVMYAHSALLGARFGPLYGLPAVFLLAGIAVCEATGDRWRGLLAVGALVGYLFGVPLAHALGLKQLGLPALSHGLQLMIEGLAVALVGILPPLVHLRSESAPAA